MIQPPDAHTLSKYRVGEDVVVRLKGIEVHDVERGGLVPVAFLPPWTIAAISGIVQSGSYQAYVLQLQICHDPCVCTAGEDAIEGTA